MITVSEYKMPRAGCVDDDGPDLSRTWVRFIVFFTMENGLCVYYALGGAITNVFYVVNALDGQFASTK